MIAAAWLFLKGVPPWLLGVVLLIALFVGSVLYAHHVGDREGFARATSERTARHAIAVFTRVQSNTALSIKQDAINASVTKVKNEELAPVVQRIHIDRVRVGAGTCGPAASADPQGTSSSDGTYPPGRLVRDDVERDTRALTEAVEQDLATGRACQAFVRQNGMGDPAK